jgi:cell division protein FtsQ
MSARVARGSAGAAKRGASRSGGSRSTGARKRRGKAKKQGLLDGIPISPKTVRRLVAWGGGLALVIVGAATAVAFRVPQRIGTSVGEQIGAAGFTVSRVELRGLSRMDRSTVYRSVLDQPSLAMPLVDLDAIRTRLLEYKWIKEARISRRLPDTLVVDIVERQPVAVWQHNRQLQLIDAEGVALEPVPADRLPNLPLVIGPGAQHRVAALGTILAGSPQMAPLLAGATWIGGRRWDLRFKTGETLSLPEGDELALAALRRFADINQRRQLLGGNFLRFDMRIAGKMIVQLKQAPNGQVPAIAPVQGEPPQDLSRTI